jgi:hypothetical protein
MILMMMMMMMMGRWNFLGDDDGEMELFGWHIHQCMHWWKLVRIQRVNLSFAHKIGKGNKQNTYTHTHTHTPLYRLVLTLGHTETTTPPVACTMHWMPGMTQLWMDNPLGYLLLLSKLLKASFPRNAQYVMTLQ